MKWINKNRSQIRQKSSTEKFFKTRRSEKFRNIHRKTRVLQSPFKKSYGPWPLLNRFLLRCFPVNIAKCLRTAILKKIYELLLQTGNFRRLLFLHMFLKKLLATFAKPFLESSWEFRKC